MPRGGFRENSGRKSNELTERHMIRFTKDQKQKITDHPEILDKIRELVNNY